MQQRIALELPEIAPEEIVFINDVVHNIHAARDPGWHDVHHIDIDINTTHAALLRLELPA